MSRMYSSFTFENKATCDIFHLAKQRKFPYHSSNSIASHIFELLHFDIWRPLAIPSINNHKYFLTILDDHTQLVLIILLKSRFEVFRQVQNFKTMIITKFNITPKTVRSNNGPEFTLHQFYASKGITNHRCCVENPQQNGRVERKHQHLLNVGRAIIYHSKLPNTYWSFAL